MKMSIDIEKCKKQAEKIGELLYEGDLNSIEIWFTLNLVNKTNRLYEDLMVKAEGKII